MNQDKPLTIGDLSRQTGLSVLRIRAWENRYGEPGGLQNAPRVHRRYSMEQLHRLKMLATLVETGYRIGHLTQCSDHQLYAMLEEMSAPVQSGVEAVDLWKWRQAVQKGDPQDMHQLLKKASADLPVLNFLQKHAAPMIQALGTWWASGEISITQEHVASAVLDGFLVNYRLEFGPHRGPKMLFCTLPFEQHTLGLQMASLLAASMGINVIYGGRRIPSHEIGAAMQYYGIRQVCLSFSMNADPVRVEYELRELQKILAPGCRIACGGAGVPTEISGVKVFRDFVSFQTFCQTVLEDEHV